MSCGRRLLKSLWHPLQKCQVVGDCASVLATALISHSTCVDCLEGCVSVQQLEVIQLVPASQELSFSTASILHSTRSWEISFAQKSFFSLSKAACSPKSNWQAWLVAVSWLASGWSSMVRSYKGMKRHPPQFLFRAFDDQEEFRDNTNHSTFARNGRRSLVLVDRTLP